MQVFSKVTLAKKEKALLASPPQAQRASQLQPSSGPNTDETPVNRYTTINENDTLGFLFEDTSEYTHATTFSDLLLPPWLVQQAGTLGITTPTSIQRQVIPATSHGYDILALAKTGSGKTAAFLLPILNALSRDVYGIFAVVLSPSRELALQIYDQAKVFGSPLGLGLALIIGGLNWPQQVQSLAKKPHLVIGTPGRIADHIRGNSSEFNFKKIQFAVFDEVDSLFQDNFMVEIKIITRAMNPYRQNLYFSATLSPSDFYKVQKLSCTASKMAIESGAADEFSSLPKSAQKRKQYIENNYQRVLKIYKSEDLWYTSATEQTNKELTQAYVFLPKILKDSYILYFMKCFAMSQAEISEQEQLASSSTASRTGPDHSDDDDDDDDDNFVNHRPNKNSNQGRKLSKHQLLFDEHVLEKPKNQYALSEHSYFYKYLRLAKTKAKNLIMIFCSSIKTADVLGELLQRLGHDIALLHSKLKQVIRTRNLERFRSHAVRILVTTDVAARGLDIPEVSLVINYDLPRQSEDYIHRVGRTARNKRLGYSLTLVTQYDIPAFLAVEQKIKTKIPEIKNLDEEKICVRLNTIRKNRVLAELKFESKYEESDKYLMRKQRDLIVRAQNEATKSAKAAAAGPHNGTTKKKKNEKASIP